MNFIAHRGYSGKYPENSIPAFKAVIDHPCNGSSLIGIELDIHLSADGRIPVMHETAVPGKDGIPVPVAQISFDTLQNLFLQHHGAHTPPVPAIDQVFELIDHKTELCFEIKMGTYDLDRFTGHFVAALQRYAPRGDVVISSFSYRILEHIRPLCRQFDLRYGYIFKSPEALTLLPPDIRNRFDLLHPWYRLLFDAPELFSPTGPPIRCWTVDDAATVATLTELSERLPIEAIMTNDLSLARCGQDA